MNSILQTQMDAYALMKARQGIAREVWEYRGLARHWRETNAIEAETFCYETIFALRELANHQFSHRPTIPPVTTGEHIRRGWLYSNYGRD